MDRAPATFKESVILNLRRNKEHIKEEIKHLESKLDLCDKAIELAEDNNDAMAFVETMSQLQSPRQGLQGAQG